MERSMSSVFTTLPFSNTSENTTGIDYDYYGSDYYNGSLEYMDAGDESVQLWGLFCGVVYSVIFFLSLVGNGFLLWALLRHENLRKTTNLFLLQLTISDLLLTLSLPFWAVYHLHEWVFGAAACHLITAVFSLGFYSYMLFLTAMTIDRYFSIVHAMSTLRAKTWRCLGLTSAALWTVGLAGSIPEAVFSQTVDSHMGVLCTAIPLSKTWQLVESFLLIFLFFLVPFGVIVFCYVRIWTTIRTCRTGRRHHVVRLIFSIVVVFFICWAPYNVVLFLLTLMEQGWLPPMSAASYYICQCLAFCHCFINPAFHIFGGGKFWRYLSRVFGYRWSQSFPSQSSGHRISVSQQTFV